MSKFKVGDTVKIVKIDMFCDNVQDSINYLGKEAVVTAVRSNVSTVVGTFGNYRTEYKSGYRLNIGEFYWLWHDDELELIKTKKIKNIFKKHVYKNYHWT